METLSVEEIRLLVHSGEDDKTERKRELNLSTKRSKAEFIRDMISLVNSHGERDAYLLIGVTDTGELYDISGMDIDDADVQQITTAFIEPPIQFTFNKYLLDSIQIGVFHIPASNERFHVVAKDYSENQYRLLEKGDTWIKKGSSKQRPTGWDYKLLREQFARQSIPKPILDVTFDNATPEMTVSPKWEAWNPYPSNKNPGRLDFRIENTEEYPSGVAQLKFNVYNNGKTQADNIKVFINIPVECDLIEEIDPPGAFVIPNRRLNLNLSFNYDAGIIEINYRKLVHNLYHTSEISLVRFPKTGCYELSWSAHAGNMIEQYSGILKIEVSN